MVLPPDGLEDADLSRPIAVPLFRYEERTVRDSQQARRCFIGTAIAAMLSAAGGLALATLVSRISPLVVLSDRVDILGDGFSNGYAIAIRVRRSPKSSFGEAQVIT